MGVSFAGLGQSVDVHCPDIDRHGLPVLVNVGVPNDVQVLQARSGDFDQARHSDLGAGVSLLDVVVDVVVGLRVLLRAHIVLDGGPVRLVAHDPKRAWVGVHARAQAGRRKRRVDVVSVVWAAYVASLTVLAKAHHKRVLGPRWTGRRALGGEVEIPSRVQVGDDVKALRRRHFTLPGSDAEAAVGERVLVGSQRLHFRIEPARLIALPRAGSITGHAGYERRHQDAGQNGSVGYAAPQRPSTRVLASWVWLVWASARLTRPADVCISGCDIHAWDYTTTHASQQPCQ